MLKIKFFSVDNQSIIIEGSSIQDCLRQQKSINNNKFTPIAFAECQGRFYYFDENLVNELIREEISIKDFVIQCQCIRLWRNIFDINGNFNHVIEQGSLFKQIEDKLYLIDDDNYYETSVHDFGFEKIIFY